MLYHSEDWRGWSADVADTIAKQEMEFFGRASDVRSTSNDPMKNALGKRSSWSLVYHDLFVMAGRRMRAFNILGLLCMC